MKHIPLYSLVLFPPSEQSATVKSYKQLLRNAIGWFSSANSAGHITIIQFKNDLELSLYINQVREFCKTVVIQNVTLNVFGTFENSGAFYIAPDTTSKLYLDSLILSMHEFLGFKIDQENVNAHMSIGRKLFGDNMKTTKELFNAIRVNLQFPCDALYVRKFNEDTQQYSDIVEKITFGK